MESCWCVHLVTGDRVVTLAPVILSSLITVDDDMVKCPSVVTRYREREREGEEPTAGGGVLITVLHLRETLAQKTLTPSSGGCTLSMQNTVMSEWYTGGERERKKQVPVSESLFTYSSCASSSSCEEDDFSPTGDPLKGKRTWMWTHKKHNNTLEMSWMTISVWWERRLREREKKWI